MLTAHLPSGYILARNLPNPMPLLFGAAILGSIAPDFDIFWFYFVDNKAFHHHRYWVHIPLFWLVVGSVSITLSRLFASRYTAPIAVFIGAIFMHLLLDSVGGGVMWGAPFSNELIALVEVPATRSHWILSFVFHWTFWAEVLIWLWAVVLWFGGRRA